MTQNVLTKPYFHDLINQIFSDLIVRDWASAHQKAKIYTSHMNQAFAEGYHQVAIAAQKGLQRLREPTYNMRYRETNGYDGLTKERLYRAFVVEYCPLDPWLAQSFILNDDSGSDSKLVEGILKNGFFRPEHLVDEVEKESEAAPRLKSTLELIQTFVSNGNLVLASKLIEGLLHDSDLKASPFVFNDQVVSLLGSGRNDLFFRDFLESMAPRIQDICDWSYSDSPRREPVYKAQDRSSILRLASQGLPNLALDLYLHSKGKFTDRNEIINAEFVFQRKFTLWMIAELSHSSRDITMFAAYVEYFIQDPKNQWVFDSDDAIEAMNEQHGKGSFFMPPAKVDALGTSLERSAILTEQAAIITDAIARHADAPGIDEKRRALMQQYVASHIKTEQAVFKEIRDLYPKEFLMDIPGFAENQLQEDLGL